MSDKEVIERLKLKVVELEARINEIKESNESIKVKIEQIIPLERQKELIINTVFERKYKQWR